MKVYYPDSRVTARQFFFSIRVVQLWNKLPEEVVSASSVNACVVCYCFVLVQCVSSLTYLLGQL